MKGSRLHALLLLLAATVVAQTTDKNGVRLRFRAMAFDDPIPGASYLEGDELRRIDIPNNGFTRETAYDGGKTLRFITIDDETMNPQPLSPEISAATQRLRRAQAVTLQASDEYGQIGRLLDTFNHQASESGRPPSPADRSRIEALNDRLRQLSDILATATRETEEINLLILRLESAPRPAPPSAAKKKPKEPRPLSTPTAEYTFQKDGRYLLVFSSAGNGHQILALDDSEGAFPFGSCQFVNLTGKDIEIRYPDRKVALRTNGRVTVRNPAADHQYALAEIHTKAEDGYELGHVFRSLQHPDTRSLIFLLPLADEPHAIRSKGIEDRRTAEAKDAK